MWSNKKNSFTVLLKNYFFGNGKIFFIHIQQFIHQSKALLNPKKLIKPKLEHFKHQNPLIRMFEKTKSFEKKRNVIRNSIFLPRVYLSN